MMAVTLLIVSLILSVKYEQIRAQTEYIPYEIPASCNTTQFFDKLDLKCKLCPQNTTVSSDQLNCECKDGYKYITNFGGENVQCEKCPPNQARSQDGWRCVSCPTDAVFDSSTSRCNACPDLPVEREINGAIVAAGHVCRTCTDLTFRVGNRCERCTAYLSLDSTLTDCQCPIANQKGGLCFASTATPDFNVPLSSGDVASMYLTDNLEAAYTMCRIRQNSTACIILSNLCVLTWYEFDGTNANRACNMYKEIEAATPESLPMLYYEEGNGDRILEDTSQTTVYTFNPVSYLNFQVARYSIDGKFLGISPVTNGLLQLCTDTTKKLDAAYTFGTYYSQSCSIPAIDLWDQTKYPMEFYDMYLKFTKTGAEQMYKTPLRILNYVSSGSTVNTGSDAQDWQLVRRFFMVDNVASGPVSPPEYVRYVKSIEIIVRLTETGDGTIYPPYFNIEYDQVSLTSANEGATISPTFTVTYWMSQIKFRRDFQIATGTLSTLGILYAGYRAWVWSKRAGKLAIDFGTILNFMFFAAGSLANVFFVISFGIAFYFLIFFKDQDVLFLFHLRDLAEEEWLALFGAAFTLKALQIIHLIVIQCTADVFFIDWERPRGGGQVTDSKKPTGTVSIWRTYFIANEWNEIQTTRKVNHIFQIFAVVFFLYVVGFENVATKDPDGSVIKDSSEYMADMSTMFRYGIAGAVYLIVGVVQWIFFTFIYERFVEDSIRQFVDLCSMSNISVFVMAHAQFGYYIHGRSVHGRADTNMKEMFEMMKREEEDLCGQRGLVPNTDNQTFMMSLPRKLRLKYEQVMLPVALENAGAVGAPKGKSSATGKQVEAYSVINRFLSAFIDHSLKDLDYVVKDKTLLESIMDTEFFDASEKGIFYNDDGHSFDNCLFYGNEGTLLLFDTLLFCIIDLIATNFVLAGVITYIIMEIIAIIRRSGGEKNLAKKTLVDERFLI
ncbi:meckelin-like [Mizuhopecten yessoensis]|uniref:meckelin-like n=1 Tax=Mizuhopecten yessoensis TaxID=6573 RepID=UPI000B45A0E8|nr:meckelin-like [Mizuhopecten yessoensis]